MPAAVELPLLVKVDEIDEQLLADGAREAVGMPAAVGAGPRGADANVPGVDGARTLQSDESKCYCPLLAINASAREERSSEKLGLAHSLQAKKTVVEGCVSRSFNHATFLHVLLATRYSASRL